MNRKVMRLAAFGFVVGDIDPDGHLVREELVTIPVNYLWPFNTDCGEIARQVEIALNQEKRDQE